MELKHKQPNLEVRVKNIIQESGVPFKDLNNNGKLDPYEGWRLSPRERAENLVSLINLDERLTKKKSQ